MRHRLGSVKFGDSAGKELIYWRDVVVWEDADINKNVKDIKFFQSEREYKNGLLVNYISDALYYKSIAKGYFVQVQSKGYDAIDSVWILPVKVKYKTGFEADTETTTLNLIKKNSVDFRGNSDYDIRDVELLRKKDKRRLRQVKEYIAPPPN